MQDAFLTETGQLADVVLSAANELTITGYDPVRKQPFFKFAAAKIRKLEGVLIVAIVGELIRKTRPSRVTQLIVEPKVPAKAGKL